MVSPRSISGESRSGGGNDPHELNTGGLAPVSDSTRGRRAVVVYSPRGRWPPSVPEPDRAINRVGPLTTTVVGRARARRGSRSATRVPAGRFQLEVNPDPPTGRPGSGRPRPGPVR